MRSEDRCVVNICKMSRSLFLADRMFSYDMKLVHSGCFLSHELNSKPPLIFSHFTGLKHVSIAQMDLKKDYSTQSFRLSGHCSVPAQSGNNTADLEFTVLFHSALSDQKIILHKQHVNRHRYVREK